MNLKLVIAAVALVISILVSALFSYKTYSTDFPCFYYVASTILDPQASNEDIYRYTEDTENRYSIPEKKEVKDTLLYSVPAAYLLAPLGLMPYYMAKATMIFLNMVAYLFAVAMILKLSNASSRDITWGTAIACLWLPFFHTIGFANIDAFILFLVASAVFAVTSGHPYLCGALFATYLWLNAVNPVLVFLYPVIIGITTALITVFAKSDDYPLLASFAIPAVFLAMPRLEYNHLTLLVFTYGYLLASKKI